MVGDHVTVLPIETMEKSPVDYVIAGGDYDFVLSDLLDSITTGKVLPGRVWGKSKG